MKYKNKGFTLVELIITVTILSILGVISFISLQSYNTYARNAIRIDDIGKIATIINEKKITTGNILGVAFTGSEITNAQISGTGAIVEKNYKAGNYNSQVLNIKDTQFQDPLTEDIYKVGVTNLKKGKFEVAGTLEDDIGDTAIVMGNYTARTQEFLSVSSSTGSLKVTIDDYSKIGTFFIGDTITGSLVEPGTTIKSISRDGLTFVLSSESVASSGDISLASNEVKGLIKGLSGNPVVNNENEVVYSTNNSRSDSNSSSSSGSGGGAIEGPSGAIAPINTWTAYIGNTNISLPDSDTYNNFTVDSAANNSGIVIEVGNQNVSIDTRWGDDSITTGYGNNDINITGGNNFIVVGDGFNDIFMGSSGTNNVTFGDGDNYIETDGGSININGGEGDNEFLLGYGSAIEVILGNGDNTINGTNGGNFEITLGNGNNIISPGAFGNHRINLGNGDNILNGVGGSSIVNTGTNGSANITFGGNQSQRLIWRGGNIILNDYWRWGNNRISFEEIDDINNCSDITNNVSMIGSQATITSTEGTLTINIQGGQTELNCNTNMIFN